MGAHFESVYRRFESYRPSLAGGGAMPLESAMSERPRIITPVVILEAPDWLTFEQAVWLSGWDRDIMAHIVEIGGVDLNDAGLIDKESLLEFQETMLEIWTWND